MARKMPKGAFLNPPFRTSKLNSKWIRKGPAFRPRGCSNHDYAYHDCSHYRLFLHHRRRATAERQERGHRGGVWRHGQPDCLRPARRSQRTFQSDYLVSGDLHGDLDHAVHRSSPTAGGDFSVLRCQAGPHEVAARSPGSEASGTSTEVAVGRSFLLLGLLGIGGLFFGRRPTTRGQRLECIHDPRNPARRSARVQLFGNRR